jgi:hypothetical protein
MPLCGNGASEPQALETSLEDTPYSSPRYWLARLQLTGLEVGELREGVAGFTHDWAPGCPPPLGLLRRNGSLITQPTYSLVGEPSEGLVPVCVPQSGATKPDTCQACFCNLQQNLCGYVDLDGHVRIPLEHAVDFVNRAYPEELIGGFHFGLAAIQEAASLNRGYIDRSGAWAIRPVFADAGEFAANGLAPASAPGGKEERFDLGSGSGHRKRP